MSATVPSVAAAPRQRSLPLNSLGLLTSAPRVPFLDKKPLRGLRGTFHFDAGDVRREAPLEQELGVRRLIIAVQLPAHEVFSESLRTGGARRPRSTGPLAGISC